jgi:SWI/SNF-related matrix-associated actin-dependent regulator 1 of chromatin subfamily A
MNDAPMGEFQPTLGAITPESMAQLVVRLEGDLYVAESRIEHKEILKGAGFWWDVKRRRWTTRHHDVAYRLVDYATEDAKVKLEAMRTEHERSIAASKATTADIVIPCPDGLAYMPFQKAGIAFALSRPATVRGTLIGDEMGLGKTIQAIGIANADAAVQVAVIICPASLKLNWQREIRKWDVYQRKVLIGSSKPNEHLLQALLVARPFWLILNYDILHNWRDLLAQVNVDLLVLDEAHYVKNSKARRTIAIFGGELAVNKSKDNPGGDVVELDAVKARRLVAMTGTPIVNRPKELWTLVQALDPEGLGSSWHRFVRRYCAGTQTSFGWDFNGASNLEELQDRLRAGIMVRRLKKDVLTELPPKRRSIMALEPEGDAAGLVAEEMAAWKRMQEVLEQLRVAAELAKAEGEDIYKDAVSRLRQSFSASFTEISRIRHELAIKKIPYVIEYVKDAALDKMVVFVHHQDVCEAIAKEFGDGAVVVHGGIRDLKERQKAVDAFQTDPNITVFVGTIGAAGVGLTLTESSHVLFGELDWTPGKMSQAEDRCHRIGSEKHESINIRHLVFDDSLDARMAQILVEKQEVIDRALDRSTDGHETYEKIDAAVMPVFTDRAATEDISRKEVEEQAADITERQIEAIHLGLRMLAGMDQDYAAERNDMGFSRFDVKIGHSLAERSKLTPKQAVLGLRLVNKYRRQLPAELLAQAKGESSN